MKKIVSVFTSIIIILSVFQVTAFSYNDENLIIHYDEEKYQNVIFDDCDWELTDNSVTDYANFYQYGFNVGSYVYSAYSILNVTEKLLYDELCSSLNAGNLSVKVSFSPALSSNDFSNIDWKQLLNAVKLDRPDFFFITSLSRSWATYSNGDVAYITLTVKSPSYYDDSVTLYTEAEIAECSAALENAVKSIDVDLDNRYNFVESVHDYLCNNIVYVNNQLRCHDAYGALVEGDSVCQGYAEAFKLICNYYKIPCVLLTGTANGGGHMWNAVQMDDGKWYLLDVTWDDQTDSYGIFYDFFLIGLNTKDTYFGGEAFSASHVSDGSPYLPVLSYATDKYTETNHNTAFKATYNSLAKNDGNYLIRSYFDSENTYVYYNGMYIETDNLTTNDVFEAPSGENGNTEEWTLILLGDCNGDGSCDAADYSDAVNKLLADNGVSDASDMAADMDCDGALDVIDLAIIQLATSGLNTQIEIE